MTSRSALAQAAEDPPSVDVLSVTEVCARMRDALRAIPQPLFVRGEVRDLVRAPSGHVYFSLRDDGATIACVLFRRDAARSRSDAREGVEVVVEAHVDLYPERGLSQLVVRSLHARGFGDLWIAFERTRSALEGEGLLDPERKRPLPRVPRRVGLVTSEAGEALHDVVQTLRRRFPLAAVVLSPAAVQGEDAPESLRAALRRLRARGVDVIILARGGGSAEDLWAFNDEALAREIAGSPVPVVAAIGHETNVTIAGMVADVRAPTPSAAAFLVSPDLVELRGRFSVAARSSLEAVARRLRDLRQRVDRLAPSRAVEALRDRERSDRQALGAVARRLREAAGTWERLRARLDALRRELDALGPGPTLERGYAIVSRKGVVLNSAALAAADDLLHITFRDGEIRCRVLQANR